MKCFGIKGLVGKKAHTSTWGLSRGEPCLTWYIKQKQDDYYDVMHDPRQSSGVRSLNTR